MIMGDIVPYERLILKQTMKEAKRELEHLYQITAGFTEPEPLDEEQRIMQEEGMWEG